MFQNHNGGLVAASPVHFNRTPEHFQKKGHWRQGGDYALDSIADVDVLMKSLGINFSSGVIDEINRIQSSYAMDSIQQPLTAQSLTTPIQFLQNWLPGYVQIVTAAREADEIIGRATVGSWEDAQIVQQVIENTGSPVPYTDSGNIPLTDWNPNFVTRAVVRFEQGLNVGALEMAQSARMRIDTAGQKRYSAGEQMEIQRNAVAFYGYNAGHGLTFGFLNDPNLPNYVNVPNGGWATATFLEIQQDLLTAIQALRTQSQGRIKPDRMACTLTLPTNSIDYLSTTSDFGNSVREWLTETYPMIRVVDAPQLNLANGGANVFYLFADAVPDSGTDDHRTFIQVVPATFQLLGVEKGAKGYKEDYSNATAGSMCKRPYAVVRRSGI